MVRKLVMMTAAAGLAFAPVAGASAATSLSVARAMAPMTGASFLQDDDDDDDDGTIAVVLGLVLVVLLVAIVTGDSRNEPANSP